MSKRVLEVTIWVAVLTGAGAVRAQEEKEPKKAREEERIEVDFDGKTLQQIFEIMQEQTGAFYLYPDALKARPVFVSGVKSLTRRQLDSVFQVVLELNGYAMVSVPVWPGVVITKVVQTQHGRNYPGPTFGRDEILADPEKLVGIADMVTVIWPLRYAQAMNVHSSLRQLLDPRGGTIFGIQYVDVLVLTDFAPAVLRMVEILKLMDVPGPPLSMDVVRLQYATAEDLLPILSQLASITRDYQQQRAGGQARAGSIVNFVHDERTNSIIMQGDLNLLERLKGLVADLDVALDYEPSRIHIYALKHTNAEDVSATVNDLLQSVSLRQLGTAYGSTVLPGPGLAPPPGGPRVPAPRPTPAETRRDRDEDRAAAIPDEITNSIIVVAGEAEYRVIRKVIESLDVRRPQVLIEVVILEVSEGDDYHLGIELTTLDGVREGSIRGFAATRFGFSNLVDEDGIPIQGGGIPRGQLPMPTSGILGIHRSKEWRIPAIINLMGSDSLVNVMSAPRIVTDDNKEAKLKVTDNRPVATSTSTAAVENQVSFGGFQEAGIEISITPHISENDYLRLEINQTISEFTGSAVTGAGGALLPPPKTTKDLRNVITVPDGKTVIIGGLTDRYKQTTVSKIPILGDIPLLGQLFRSTKTEWRRKNFYVFITPHIIRGDHPEEYDRISRRQLEEAAGVGAEVDRADPYYRTAFEEERGLEAAPRGRLHSVMEYRSLRTK